MLSRDAASCTNASEEAIALQEAVEKYWLKKCFPVNGEYTAFFIGRVLYDAVIDEVVLVAFDEAGEAHEVPLSHAETELTLEPRDSSSSPHIAVTSGSSDDSHAGAAASKDDSATEEASAAVWSVLRSTMKWEDIETLLEEQDERNALRFKYSSMKACATCGAVRLECLSAEDLRITAAGARPSVVTLPTPPPYFSRCPMHAWWMQPPEGKHKYYQCGACNTGKDIRSAWAPKWGQRLH